MGSSDDGAAGVAGQPQESGEDSWRSTTRSKRPRFVLRLAASFSLCCGDGAAGIWREPTAASGVRAQVARALGRRSRAACPPARWSTSRH